MNTLSPRADESEYSIMKYSSRKPTIVFVPGSMCPRSHYQHVADELMDKGYTSIVLSLRSAGVRPSGPATMEDDAAYIRAHLQALADNGHEIILVTHSYSGFPGTEAALGVSKAEYPNNYREQQTPRTKRIIPNNSSANIGGVIRVVYLSATVPGKHESSADAYQADSVSWLSSFVIPHSRSDDNVIFHAKPYRGEPIDSESSIYIAPFQDIDAAARALFNDISLDEARHLVENLLPHSIACFSGKTSKDRIAYEKVPVSYIKCLDDQVIPKEQQDSYIAKIERLSGMTPDVHELQTGHCPNVSQPDEVVRILIKIANLSGKSKRRQPRAV